MARTKGLRIGIGGRSVTVPLDGSVKNIGPLRGDEILTAYFEGGEEAAARATRRRKDTSTKEEVSNGKAIRNR